MERIERGEMRVQTAATVIFEVVITLQGKVYRQTREMIRDALLPLIEMPGIVLPGKQYVRDALDLYVDLRLPFADAYHAAIVKDDGLGGIVTFDIDFDRIPGIQRIEP
jgi:predicted nucleic acid-binding protein